MFGNFPEYPRMQFDKMTESSVCLQGNPIFIKISLKIDLDRGNFPELTKVFPPENIASCLENSVYVSDSESDGLGTV
jgi:hypothetical protein